MHQLPPFSEISRGIVPLPRPPTHSTTRTSPTIRLDNYRLAAGTVNADIPRATSTGPSVENASNSTFKYPNNARSPPQTTSDPDGSTHGDCQSRHSSGQRSRPDVPSHHERLFPRRRGRECYYAGHHYGLHWHCDKWKREDLLGLKEFVLHVLRIFTDMGLRALEDQGIPCPILRQLLDQEARKIMTGFDQTNLLLAKATYAARTGSVDETVYFTEPVAPRDHATA